MFNPILAELVAREQNNDRIRQAEQRELVKAAIVRQPANRLSLLAYFGNRFAAAWHALKALADKANGRSEMSAGRHRP
jgi:hypothetical protein